MNCLTLSDLRLLVPIDLDVPLLDMLCIFRIDFTMQIHLRHFLKCTENTNPHTMNWYRSPHLDFFLSLVAVEWQIYWWVSINMLQVDAPHRLVFQAESFLERNYTLGQLF